MVQAGTVQRSARLPIIQKDMLFLELPTLFTYPLPEPFDLLSNGLCSRLVGC